MVKYCSGYCEFNALFYVCRVELSLFLFSFICHILACFCVVCLCYHINNNNNNNNHDNVYGAVIMT